MSNLTGGLPTADENQGDWAALREEAEAEYRASDELTAEEKRFLDEMENLPEEEWQPIACPGQPLSETIIEERGAR